MRIPVPQSIRRANKLTTVSFTAGRELARNFGCKFIETSAKSRINVENAFYDIVREIRKYNRDIVGGAAGRPGNGGPAEKMDMADRDEDGGCCKCTVM